MAQSSTSRSSSKRPNNVSTDSRGLPFLPQPRVGADRNSGYNSSSTRLLSGRSQRIASSSSLSSTRISVPKPVNLPSLKKEHAGNDPRVSLVIGSSLGWSKQHANGSSLVQVAQLSDKGSGLTPGRGYDGTWTKSAQGSASLSPAQAKSRAQLYAPPGVRADITGESVPKSTIQDEEEFPSLQASVKSMQNGHLKRASEADSDGKATLPQPGVKSVAAGSPLVVQARGAAPPPESDASWRRSSGQGPVAHPYSSSHGARQLDLSDSNERAARNWTDDERAPLSKPARDAGGMRSRSMGRSREPAEGQDSIPWKVFGSKQQQQQQRWLGASAKESLVGVEPPPTSHSLEARLARKRKEELAAAEFRDMEREKFEAELELVQKQKELERQKRSEEERQAMEAVRSEREAVVRRHREEEERRILALNEVREVEERSAREAEEVARRMEEEKRTFLEEKRRLAEEEEKRKENARKKLLELEERIAKREAEKKQKAEHSGSSEVFYLEDGKTAAVAVEEAEAAGAGASVSSPLHVSAPPVPTRTFIPTLKPWEDDDRSVKPPPRGWNHQPKHVGDQGFRPSLPDYPPLSGPFLCTDQQEQQPHESALLQSAALGAELAQFGFPPRGAPWSQVEHTRGTKDGHDPGLGRESWGVFREEASSPVQDVQFKLPPQSVGKEDAAPPCSSEEEPTLSVGGGTVMHGHYAQAMPHSSMEASEVTCDGVRSAAGEGQLSNADDAWGDPPHLHADAPPPPTQEGSEQQQEMDEQSEAAEGCGHVSGSEADSADSLAGEADIGDTGGIFVGSLRLTLHFGSPHRSAGTPFHLLSPDSPPLSSAASSPIPSTICFGQIEASIPSSVIASIPHMLHHHHQQQHTSQIHRTTHHAKEGPILSQPPGPPSSTTRSDLSENEVDSQSQGESGILASRVSSRQSESSRRGAGRGGLSGRIRGRGRGYQRGQSTKLLAEPDSSSGTAPLGREIEREREREGPLSASGGVAVQSGWENSGEGVTHSSHLSGSTSVPLQNKGSSGPESVSAVGRLNGAMSMVSSSPILVHERSRASCSAKAIDQPTSAEREQGPSLTAELLSLVPDGFIQFGAAVITPILIPPLPQTAGMDASTHSEGCTAPGKEAALDSPVPELQAAVEPSAPAHTAALHSEPQRASVPTAESDGGAPTSGSHQLPEEPSLPADLSLGNQAHTVHQGHSHHSQPAFHHSYDMGTILNGENFSFPPDSEPMDHSPWGPPHMFTGPYLDPVMMYDKHPFEAQFGMGVYNPVEWKPNPGIHNEWNPVLRSQRADSHRFGSRPFDADFSSPYQFQNGHGHGLDGAPWPLPPPNMLPPFNPHHPHFQAHHPPLNPNQNPAHSHPHALASQLPPNLDVHHVGPLAGPANSSADAASQFPDELGLGESTAPGVSMAMQQQQFVGSNGSSSQPGSNLTFRNQNQPHLQQHQLYHRHQQQQQAAMHPQQYHVSNSSHNQYQYSHQNSSRGVGGNRRQGRFVRGGSVPNGAMHGAGSGSQAVGNHRGPGAPSLTSFVHRPEQQDGLLSQSRVSPWPLAPVGSSGSRNGRGAGSGGPQRYPYQNGGPKARHDYPKVVDGSNSEWNSNSSRQEHIVIPPEGRSVMSVAAQEEATEVDKEATASDP